LACPHHLRWFASSCALAGLALLAACPKPAAEPVTLKVLSYNLRHDVDWWQQRFPLIADEIVRLQPDLIGLQEVEVGIGQESTLRDLILERDATLDYHLYRELKSGIAAASGEGVAIFSRFELGPLAKLDLPEGRVLVHARVEIAPRLAVGLFNTHLDARADDQHRFAQIQEVLSFIDQREAGEVTLLTGDLNDTDGSRTVRQVVEAGFVDTFRARHGERTAELGATSPILLRTEPVSQNPTRRIDYVFQRPLGAATVDVMESAVVFDQPDAQGLYPSDHLGVLTTLKVRPTTTE